MATSDKETHAVLSFSLTSQDIFAKNEYNQGCIHQKGSLALTETFDSETFTRLVRDTSPSAMIRSQFYLLYEIQKHMPIRAWRRNDLAGAMRYKQQSLALAKQLPPR